MKKQLIPTLLALAVLLCLPLLGYADITVDPDINFENGHTTVYWTASKEDGPFMVAYQLQGEGDAVQAAFWAGGDQKNSTTSKQYFTLDSLISGQEYEIEVFNENGDNDSIFVTVPEQEPFEDGKLKSSHVRTSVDFRRNKKGSDSIGSVDRFDASDMMKKMDDYYFGLRYEITLPELAYARDYFVQIAIYAPNGYMQTVHTSQYEFSTGSGFTHYLRFIGDGFFTNLYKKNGEIPAGTYTIELYFNGMLANTRTFKVR